VKTTYVTFVGIALPVTHIEKAQRSSGPITREKLHRALRLSSRSGLTHLLPDILYFFCHRRRGHILTAKCVFQIVSSSSWSESISIAFTFYSASSASELIGGSWWWERWLVANDFETLSRKAPWFVYNATWFLLLRPFLLPLVTFDMMNVNGDSRLVQKWIGNLVTRTFWTFSLA